VLHLKHKPVKISAVINAKIEDYMSTNQHILSKNLKLSPLLATDCYLDNFIK